MEDYKQIKEFKIVGREITWKCKAETEQEAWESLAQIKRLPIAELKKQFKLVNDDIRTKLDD